MSAEPRKAIFAAVKDAVPDVWNDPGHIHAMDNLLDALGVPRASERREINRAGLDLIKSFEGCAKKRADGRIDAYPDPGTGGAPWTIGWGSTGPGIVKGTIWTQQQCDERLAADLVRYAAEVSSAIGNAPTAQNQFDALVSFHYNTGKIGSATLTKKHVAGDYDGAYTEFGKWVFAGGNVLPGLVRRRAAEASLYGAA